MLNIKEKEKKVDIKKDNWKILKIFWIILTFLLVFIVFFTIFFYKTIKENNKIQNIKKQYNCNIIYQIKNKWNIKDNPYICYINNKKLYSKYENYNYLYKKENLIKLNNNTVIVYNKKDTIQQIIFLNLLKELKNNPKYKKILEKYNKERTIILKKMNKQKTLNIMLNKTKDLSYYLKLYFIYWNIEIKEDKTIQLLKNNILYKNWNYYYKIYKVKNKELQKIQNENIQLFKQLLLTKNYKKYLLNNNLKKK